MGYFELEDIFDGKVWLVKQYGVDLKCVGIYGGSYGGFMIEMVLLCVLGEFVVGVVLCLLLDWVIYNYEYILNIFNDLQFDLEVYKISLLIEYVVNLCDLLLI